MTNYLTYETPAATDLPVAPSKAEIAADLSANANAWAIVARVDRRARAEAMVERILSGKEYGAGFEAVNRQVGPEHRVYARKVA